MTKDEQFALLKKELLPKIASWADLYEYFGDKMAQVRTTMHPALVFDALFNMYAFILAMKEMPDEGDIQKLAERMLHIIVYESQEKLGANANVMSVEEVMERVQAQAAKVIEAIVEVASAEGADAATSEKPRILH